VLSTLIGLDGETHWLEARSSSPCTRCSASASGSWVAVADSRSPASWPSGEALRGGARLVGGGEAPVSPMLLVACAWARVGAALAGSRRAATALQPRVWRDGSCARRSSRRLPAADRGAARTTASRAASSPGSWWCSSPLELLFFRKRPRRRAAGIASPSPGWRSVRRGAAVRPAARDVLTVGCAVVFAGHIIVLGRVAGRHRCCAASVSWPARLQWQPQPGVRRAAAFHSDRARSGVLYLSVFATLLAFGVQTWAQRKLPPVRMALLSALEPAFAALWAAVLIGERLSRLELWVGAHRAGVAVGETGTALLAGRKAGRVKWLGRWISEARRPLVEPIAPAILAAGLRCRPAARARSPTATPAR